jgi:hypothetical protein
VGAKTTERRTEVVCGVTSLTAIGGSPRVFALVRAHWGIESKRHLRGTVISCMRTKPARSRRPFNQMLKSSDSSEEVAYCPSSGSITIGIQASGLYEGSILDMPRMNGIRCTCPSCDLRIEMRPVGYASKRVPPTAIGGISNWIS